VLIATACTAVPAFVVKKLIDANLESLAVIGTSLVVGGVVMVAVDLWRARAEREGPERWDNAIKTWEMEEMSVGQSIWIGLCQTLAAVFPGTSRSMATIASGQIAGLSRATALEFSFFVSMPTMAIAANAIFFRSGSSMPPHLKGSDHSYGAPSPGPGRRGWPIAASILARCSDPSVFRDEAAWRAMSFCETTPTGRFWLSSTGTRRICFSLISRSHSSSVSSSRQKWTRRAIASSTGMPLSGAPFV
jgi:hypothetical protein